MRRAPTCGRPTLTRRAHCLVVRHGNAADLDANGRGAQVIADGPHETKTDHGRREGVVLRDEAVELKVDELDELDELELV